MKSNKSKISFNATPVERAQQADQRIVEQVHETELENETQPNGEQAFDRAVWEQDIEPFALELQPAPQSAAMAEPAHRKQIYTSRLAALGQMAQREPTFFEQNGRFVGVAAMIGVTFVFALGTAIWMSRFDDSEVFQELTFSTPVEAPSENLDETQFADTATRAVAADLTNVSAAAPSVVISTALQPDVAGVTEQESKAAILNREALEILSRNKIRMLREAVLAKVFDIETIVKNGTARVRLRTINTSLLSEDFSAMLLAAMAAGEIELSKSLMTPEGDIDLDTMMFNLVQTSLIDQNSAETMDAARDMSRKIFAASLARTENINGTRYYRVQPGDSLAYIALQFFGNPAAYGRIMAVNGTTLQSPDAIQIGQRLIISS